MNTPPFTDRAASLYAAYCRAVGGKTFNGDPLPDWEQFSTDPNKQTQANAWRAIGGLVDEAVAAESARLIEMLNDANEQIDRLRGPHHENCAALDRCPDGILKPCDCGAFGKMEKALQQIKQFGPAHDCARIAAEALHANDPI